MLLNFSDRQKLSAALFANVKSGSTDKDKPAMTPTEPAQPKQVASAQPEAQNDLKKLQEEATKILMQVASNKNQQSMEMQWLRS